MAPRKFKHNRPTIGMLAGWQAYQGTIHSFLDNVFRGVQAAATHYNFNLLIGCGIRSISVNGIWNTALPIISPTVNFIPVGHWNTDGLICAAPIFDPTGLAYFEGLVSQGFPVVFAGDRETSPCVIVDNEGGIIQAVDHLVGHGHQKIAFLAGYTHAEGDSASRLRGFQLGLLKHGLEFNPNLVDYGLHEKPASYQATIRMLERGIPFTAIIASNDETAVGAMDALRDSGLSVPQDVAVIGFDDRLEARAQIPLLTTVHHPMFELGFQSAELLYQIIQGKAQPDPVLRIPTSLVIRESCGCLPDAGRLRIDKSKRSVLTLDSTSESLTDEDQPATAVSPSKIENSQVKSGRTENSPSIVQQMTDAVYKEMQRMDRREVEYLCSRLLEAFKTSLAHGNATTFRQSIQQILEHVAKVGDDLYAWQGAVSIIKERAVEVMDQHPYTLPQSQIDHMLHQARIAISEVSRGQYSRLLVHQTAVANQISDMTARFFAASSEKEIYEIFGQSLPGLGIQTAVVALYDNPGFQSLSTNLIPVPQTEPYTWSLLKMACPDSTEEVRFVTRHFPPPGIFSEDRTYQLAVLPMVGPEGEIGFTAFSTEDFDPLGSIVNQLIASLRSVQLHQEAVRARHMAEEAQQMAEEANYLKSRFLSIVSHELRTPLNLINGLSNMILEQSRPVSEQEVTVNRKDLERIDVSAQHLQSLIRDVLDLARSDLGQLRLVFEPLDIAEVLEAVAVIGEKLAVDKGLIWQAEIQPNLPKIRGDRARLRQVVLNLVNNAVKFTDSGSITLSSTQTDGMVKIAVRDTGLGIPVDEQCIIFDEFRQSRRTTARGFGGLGLGLAISHRLVELHQGRIDVTSSGEEGAGSNFYIQLPVIEGSINLSTRNQNPTPAQHILLLIKDAGGSETINRHLTQLGYQVEAHPMDDNCCWTQWLEPDPPDKIVLDLGLTAAHGWEILKTLKENPSTRDIPVLFYTLENDRDAGSLLDINFLTKPLNTTELARELLTRGMVKEKENGSPAQSILVVDDDEDILELHTRVVNGLASGYRVLQARNGNEALAAVRAEKPALIMLDLAMPEMDGFAVLEHLQADETTRSIPVIVLTSQVLTEDDMARLNDGVASVLSKGMYSSKETLEHLSSALSRKRRSGTETQRLVLKAMAFIHSNYKDAISRSEVAAYVGISERHLARCFQQELGLTPIIYLNRFRVNIAKTLLASGKMSITDVAMEVGFSAGGYFTRVFREEVGMSPREYARVHSLN